MRSFMKAASIPGEPKAKYVTATWKPTKDEIGKHIMCSNVRDSDGYIDYKIAFIFSFHFKFHFLFRWIQNEYKHVYIF